MPVTAANRRQYVQLYCEWLLSRSVEKQFSAFAHGFHQVAQVWTCMGWKQGVWAMAGRGIHDLAVIIKPAYLPFSPACMDCGSPACG